METDRISSASLMSGFRDYVHYNSKSNLTEIQALWQYSVISTTHSERGCHMILKMLAICKKKKKTRDTEMSKWKDSLQTDDQMDTTGFYICKSDLFLYSKTNTSGTRVAL